MEFTEQGVVIDKEPSELDELIIDVSRVLEAVDVDYAVVSGYVAVLFGRARATEDIDVIVESFEASTAQQIADRLQDCGYWGSAMPLEELYGTLSDGLPVRIAEDGDIVPNVELKFPSDEYDDLSLRNTTTVSVGGCEIRIGSLELQIAYKLAMDTPKDFEDALYLYEVMGRNINTAQLEAYVEQLGVEDEYRRLERS
jgi:hypothetical protein